MIKPSPRQLWRALGVAILVLLSPSVVRAANGDDRVPPAEPVAPTGVSVIPPDWRAELVGAWKPQTAAGTLESSAPAPGLKLITSQQPENVYNLQTSLLNQIPLKQGDTLFMRFAARSLKPDFTSGVTKLRVNFSRNAPPWESSYGAEIGVGREWQRFDVPFTCKHDFAAREAKFSFMFGFPVQTAEIADLQLIRYDPDVVAPASLPKTARRADPVTPATLATEIARIAAMRAELAGVADPAPAHGRTLHVAKTGTATGTGSAGAPFATLPQALAVAQPGDTVLVATGEYREPRGISVRVSGRPDAWIKLKAAPGTRPKIVSSAWSGIELRGGIGYVEIDGFELDWVADPAAGRPVHGSGIAPMYASHHIRVLNNVVHGFGNGGIISLDCDYLHLEGNVIYNCAKTSPYGGSAISLCRAFDFDQGAGYHNVVRGNVCNDNELKVAVLESSGGNGRILTDGNGIIIDVFNRSRANPLKPHGEDRDGPLAPYHGRTLVENNLIYDNGGRGIHVFRSSNVDVVNNTCYMNQKSADINGGEFTAIEGSHIVILNNVAYGRKEKRGNSQDGSTQVVWGHNLFFNVADVLLHDGIIEADPMFAAPGPDAKPEGFRLQPGSPALGQGIAPVAPAADLARAPRPAGGPIDLGAYQSARP